MVVKGLRNVITIVKIVATCARLYAQQPTKKKQSKKKPDITYAWQKYYCVGMLLMLCIFLFEGDMQWGLRNADLGGGARCCRPRCWWDVSLSKIGGMRPFSLWEGATAPTSWCHIADEHGPIVAFPPWWVCIPEMTVDRWKKMTKSKLTPSVVVQIKLTNIGCST